MTTTPSAGLIGRAPGGRKLVAIVHIDMVGYSRLIGLDDSGTLSRLSTLRQTLIDPAVKEHGGTIVQTAGDALLVSFDSIDGAVRCAVKVQQQVPAYDDDQPPDRRIRFRIGIGIADVIADGTDLHGDGVNIAVRLEAEAPTGGICVSRAIRDHVHDRLDLVFEERGALALKNITRPVEAFVLRLGSDTPKPATASVGAPGIALPDKPSIAVLPFTNMSNDPEQDYFSDGIVDDIITGLSRNQSFFVIARNSSFTYKGRAVDIRQVGRELGVRYVLEGSVRKAGNRARITGQLIEAATGNHIWADRFDGALDNIFALQDCVTECVVGAIEPSLQRAEIARANSKPTASLDAYDWYLRAVARRRSGTREGHAAAEEYLLRSILADPGYVLAKAEMSFLLMDRSANGWGTAESAARGITLARDVAAASPDDPEALRMAGHVLSYLAGDHDQARALLDRAVLLNPNSARVLNSAGWVYLYRSDPEPAIAFFERAICISPLDPAMAFRRLGLGDAHIQAGRNLEGLAILRRAVHEKPNLLAGYRMIILALTRLGRLQDAAAAARQILEIDPGYRLATLKFPPRGEAFWVEYRAALRRAGLPE